MQFVKYLFCGGLSFVADVVVFYLMAWIVLPSLRLDDLFGVLIGWFGGSIQPVDETLLLRHYYINKVVAFLASNTVAYVTNVLFVFSSTQRRRSEELILFYLFAILSFIVFTWLGGELIARFGWQVTISNFFVFICATMINFIMRKKLVFKE